MNNVRHLLLCLIILHFSVSTLFSQTDPFEGRFSSHPEVYVKVSTSDVRLFKPLLESFSADINPLEPNSLIVNLIESETADFLELGLPYEFIEVNRDISNFPCSSDPELILGTWNQYPTYEGYEAIMYQFQQSHPGICEIVSIGTLNSGRKLLLAHISDNIGQREPEPRFLYTSSMHGDETAGYIMLLHLIDTLLTGYGIDQRMTSLVDNMDIWINPLANPDGTYYGGNSSVAGAARRNANNVDLNRNYPDPEDGPHPDGNPWQPETVMFMALADTADFVMAANFHGGAEVANYPWDTWAQLPADNSWWLQVSNEYADTCQTYSPSGYFNDFGTGVTNGYAWYTIDGGRQDYMNYFRHCREVTLEISSTKLLPASQLENLYNYNFRSLLNYMEQATYGLHGVVRDSITGLPVSASVFINGHDIDSSHVWSFLPNGDYHRLLYAGQYNVTFSSWGYVSKTFPVTITGYQTSTLDVDLVPIGYGMEEMNRQFLKLYPNPGQDLLWVEYDEQDQHGLMYSITNHNGAHIRTGIAPSTSFSIDISELAPGFYLLELGTARTSFIKY